MDWDGLQAAAKAAKARSILGMLEADPGRAGDFSIQAGGLYFDYSKTQMNTADRDLLVAMFEAAGV
ncbi:MAG: glucose-6-phosphate isomerase, partial [Pseudomonadota bacterium]